MMAAGTMKGTIRIKKLPLGHMRKCESLACDGRRATIALDIVVGKNQMGDTYLCDDCHTRVSLAVAPPEMLDLTEES